MKEIKIIHIADLHLNDKPSDQAKAEKSLSQIIEYTKEHNIDILIVAGDVWDKTQAFGNGSGVALAFKFFREISKYVKLIFIIKGNNAHDNRNSIEMLHKFTWNLYAYEYNVVLGVNLETGEATDILRSEPQSRIDIILHGLPYPTKQSLLISHDIDTQNVNYIERYDKLLNLHRITAGDYDVVKIGVFHGNVGGATLSNGQMLAGQDIIIPPHILSDLGADYYALGHIHLPQMVAKDMYYSGSLYNKDFGELEQKYFNVITFRDKNYNLEQIPFKSKPMQIIEAKFENGKFEYDFNSVHYGAEIKFRYSVKEDERKLITQKLLDEISERLGGNVKFDAKVIPNERTERSTSIMKAKGLIDEVKEYAKVVKEEEFITEWLINKITSIEEGRGL
jgi:exonuclease SbcD